MDLSSFVFYGTILLGIMAVVITQSVTGELHKTCITFVVSAAIVSVSTLSVLRCETEQENANTRDQIVTAMDADYDCFVGNVEVETIDQTILDNIGDYECVFDHESKKIILTYAPKVKRTSLIPLRIWI